MTFASRFCSSRLLLVASGLGIAGLAFTACGNEEGSEPQGDDFELTPAVTQAALENPVRTCQEQGLQCASSATDAAGLEACGMQVAACLDAAAQTGANAAGALQQCQSSARECVRAGGSPSDCRAQFDACVTGVVPVGDAGTPPVGDAGVPTGPLGGGTFGGVLGGGSLPDGGAPGLPGGGLLAGGGLGDAGLPGGGILGGGLGDAGLPGLPGGNPPAPTDGGLPGLPGGGGLLGGGQPGSGLPGVGCLTTLRECVRADPTKALDCAEAARACIAGGTSP